MKTLTEKTLFTYRIRLWITHLLYRFIIITPFILSSGFVYIIFANLFLYSYRVSILYDTAICLAVFLSTGMELKKLLKKYSGLTDLAMLLESRDKTLNSDLSNAIQFIKKPVDSTYSRELAELAVRQAEEKADHLKLSPFLPRLGSVKKSLYVSVYLFIVIMAAVFFHNGVKQPSFLLSTRISGVKIKRIYLYTPATQKSFMVILSILEFQTETAEQ